MRNPQLNKQGGLAHLLCTEGLSKALLTQLLDQTQSNLNCVKADSPPSAQYHGVRLLSAFSDAELNVCSAISMAAKKLGIEVVAPSVKLPEDGAGWLSSLAELSDSRCDLLAVLHHASGTPYFLAAQLPSSIHVMNCGDGSHAAPIEALVELFLIRARWPDLAAIVVEFSGDIGCSGFARSTIHALTTLGVPEVRWLGDAADLTQAVEQMGIRSVSKSHLAQLAADVVIDLERLQSTQESQISADGTDRQSVRVAVCMAVINLILGAV